MSIDSGWSAGLERGRTVGTAARGFRFTEGPRWYGGALWFVDMYARTVWRMEPGSEPTAVARLDDDEPSGLGWLPDGRLLIVAMETGRLMRVESDGRVVVHADLSGQTRGSLNDMIVASNGTAYVGDMGIRLHDAAAERHHGQVLVVDPAGRVRQGADGLEAPNGHVLNEDETVLIVAQSGGSELTMFDRQPNGDLTNRRIFASLTSPPESARGGRGIPDGCCLDASGAVWYADPFVQAVVRVAPGGALLERISFPGEMPVACALGGEQRRTLYVCVAADWRRDDEATATARIDHVEVDVPGAGKP